MKEKLFKIPFSIIASKFGKKYPLRVMFFSTFRCNLSCKYCGIWKLNRKEMTTEQIKKAMKEFADAGTVLWTFTGGEPLLRKDIGKLVNYGRDLFLITTLTTNGTLLKQRVNEIKNVNYLTVSLDGPKEVNNSTRKSGIYDKVVEGIKIARKNNIEVIINAVISKVNTKNNCYGIKKLIELAEQLGCRLNFSALYTDQFNKNRVEEIIPSADSHNKALDMLKEYKDKKFNFILFSNPCIDYLKNPRKWKNCNAGRLFCDLFPDGKVVPCLFKEDQGVDGLKYGFVNAFNMLPESRNCSCLSTCYNELNCIFSLKGRSVIENFLKYITYIV
jgi:MoaA/NifB/PqqE/SkfB family radical SAM enzyme